MRIECVKKPKSGWERKRNIQTPKYVVRVNDEHSGMCIVLPPYTNRKVSTLFPALFTDSVQEQVFEGRTQTAYHEYDNIPLIRFHEQFSNEIQNVWWEWKVRAYIKCVVKMLHGNRWSQ